MISQKEAFRKGLDLIEANFKDKRLTVSSELIEFKDLYVAYVNTKEYFRTNDPKHSVIGTGPLIIDKEDGYAILYGSAHSENSAIQDYRNIKMKWQIIKKDFPKFDIQTKYNITIDKIFNLEKLKEIILSFPFQYTIPEVEGDTIWRISKPYDESILKLRLNISPTTFMEISPERIIEFYQKVSYFKVCNFKIEEYKPTLKEWNIKRATDIDLEPKW